MSNKVMLGWGSNDFSVDEAGIAMIKEIIAKYQLCPRCNERIDAKDHQLVGKKCLACVLQENTELTFVGYQGNDDEYRAIYTFIDTAGITFTSTANASDKPYQDVALSIEQAGFSIPTTYKPFKSDMSTQLHRHQWSVFGKLTQSVVLIQYKDPYHGKNGLEVIFIAYKGGQTVELNKRSTEHKNVLEKARMLAERTKKGSYYHLPHIGYPTAQLWEEHLYPIIATLESAVWDAQLAFIGRSEPEEPTRTDEAVALELPETVVVAEQEQEEIGDTEHDLDAENAPKKQRKLRIVKPEEPATDAETPTE